ncbi:MAG: M48 family metallopeptidase [Bryobacteraceae bacterium]
MLRLLFLLAALSAAAQTPPPKPPQEVKNYSLPPDKLRKAEEFAHARNQLHFVGFGYGVLVLLAVLLGRLSSRFRTWAESLSRRRIIQAYVFIASLILTVDILSLPTSLYEQYLSRKFEQSIQGWGSWWWDWTKGELIGIVISGLLVWILYGVIRRSPRRWWFYGALVAMPILVLLMFVTPVLITPLFYQFDPLAAKQPALVAEIEKVVHRGGLEIPPDRMYEMKASEKLNSLNAYVTGIGASKRVVVWDTTIRKMTPGQTLFVFGHEMGHYVLHHIWFLIAANFVMLLVFLFLGYHTIHWALARWGQRWSIRAIDDWASLPVFLLVLSIFGFLSEPLQNSFSRALEHNADIYGLEVIHGVVPNSSQVAAEAFQILGEVSLSDPNPSPFIKFWLYNHPSVSDRVRFAAEYDPWSTGQPVKYVP